MHSAARPCYLERVMTTPWRMKVGLGVVAALGLGCGYPPIPPIPTGDAGTSDPSSTSDPTSTGLPLGDSSTRGEPGTSGGSTLDDSGGSTSTTGGLEGTTHAGTSTASDSGSASTDGGTTGEASTGTSSGSGESSSGDPPPDCNPELAEVFYDIDGGDDPLEWIELYNPCPFAIDLGAYSLGWGGSDYAYGTLGLSGMLPAGACTVVGGPQSVAANGSPVLGQAVDLEPDLQNSGAIADGVALFLGAAIDIDAASVPVDAVIYGDANSSGLLDASGMAPAPHVIDVLPGETIQRTGPASWGFGVPTPGVCPPY